MTPEDKATHENGVALLNQMTNSIFSYEPLDIEIVTKVQPLCGRCWGSAEHRESMKNDTDYKRYVCTPCRDKLIWNSYRRFLKKQEGDTRNYIVTAQQASFYMKNKKLFKTAQAKQVAETVANEAASAAVQETQSV